VGDDPAHELGGGATEDRGSGNALKFSELVERHSLMSSATRPRPPISTATCSKSAGGRSRDPTVLFKKPYGEFGNGDRSDRKRERKGQLFDGRHARER
jgi:hypothetical protein